MTKAHYLHIGTVNGLTAKETMLLPVGLVYDLLEVYLRANGKGAGGELEE